MLRGLTILLTAAGSHSLTSTLASAKPGAVKLPATFKALVAASTGESFAEVPRVKELPMPELESGEVLVRVVYAGVNGGCETFRARGEYAFQGNRDAADFPLGE